VLKTLSVPKFLQAQCEKHSLPHLSTFPRSAHNPTGTPQAEQHKYLPRHFCPYSLLATNSTPHHNICILPFMIAARSFYAVLLST